MLRMLLRMPLEERPCLADHGVLVRAFLALAREKCDLAPGTHQLALARLRDELRRLRVPRLADHLAFEDGTLAAVHTASFAWQGACLAILLAGTVPDVAGPTVLLVLVHAQFLRDDMLKFVKTLPKAALFIVSNLMVILVAKTRLVGCISAADTLKCGRAVFEFSVPGTRINKRLEVFGTPNVGSDNCDARSGNQNLHHVSLVRKKKSSGDSFG